MKKILMALTLGGLLGVPLAHAQCCAPATKTADNKITLKPTTTADDNTVTLKVTGMTCDKCATSVQKALQNVEGVKAAEVSLDKGQAVVTVDAAKVKTEQLIAAVEKAGGDRHTFKAEKAPVFKCDRCGKTYDKTGSCCGAPTREVSR